MPEWPPIHFSGVSLRAVPLCNETTAKYANMRKRKLSSFCTHPHLFAYLVCFAVVNLHYSTHRQSYETLLPPHDLRILKLRSRNC